MINEVIFDVETKKLFGDIETVDPAGLGVSLVSLYKRTLNDSFEETKGEMISLWESELDQLWPTFSSADRIIGFNSIKFDAEALQPLAPYNLLKLKHFDIMDTVKNIIGRRISLNAFAKDTLGKGKIDDGINAVLYYQKGDRESLAKLKKYCEMDVLITKELYDFGFKNKYLKYTDRWNTPRVVEVDFSYPKKEGINQIGLF